jgi:phage head maturation protease
LYDVSPVWSPAYEATTCSARSQEQVYYNSIIDKSNEIDEKMNQLFTEIELM